jgi:hypothetical protein
VAAGASSFYVYGVSRPSHRVRTRRAGIGGARVRQVRHARLCALVSPLGSPLRASPNDVRAHWGVLRDTIATTTVLPLSFGTVMPSEAVVRRHLLEANEPRLARMLDQLEGLVQVAVKGRYRNEQLLAELVRTSPQIRAVRDQMRRSGGGGLAEQIELGELVVTELLRRRHADTKLALDMLRPSSVAAAEEPAPGDDGAFNLAFLVERDGDSAFGRAVAQLRERLAERIDIRYIAPLPPYSFLDADLSIGGPSWA